MYCIVVWYYVLVLLHLWLDIQNVGFLPSHDGCNIFHVATTYNVQREINLTAILFLV